MRSEWAVVIISAVTDFVITFATALTASMVEAGGGEIPRVPSLVLALLGGCVAAARTIQQALKGDALAPGGGKSATTTETTTKVITTPTPVPAPTPVAPTPKGETS